MQRLRAFAGAFLVVVGLTASIVAVPASLLVLGLVVGWIDSDETEPWVLRVASSVWQQTVSRMASVASVPLIDVSEPTENVLWEIDALTARFGSRCVVIGHHDRVSRLAAPPGSGPSAGSLDERLARLLDGREVLAYTTDRRGMRRFARALRGTLLSRSA